VLREGMHCLCMRLCVTDPTSAVYARWQERHHIHKTQFHDFKVLALVQT